MPNFKTSAHPTGDILIDETISNSSQNFRLDNVDYKFYVFLVNGDGQIFGIANDSIELLQITDNILEIAASATLIIRNDDNVIERSNYNIQLDQQENYFSRQPKIGERTVLDEFFFRNDCRDYVVVYIEPEIANIVEGTDSELIKPISTLFYTFTILDNDDFSAPDNDNIKFKKLSLIDTDIQLLNEKNLSFSSAKYAQGENLDQADDGDREIFTGELIKNLIIEGLDQGGSGESTEQNGTVIDDSLFSRGVTKLFYSSPGGRNVLGDLNYVLERHTSSNTPFEPCLLRKDRYSQLYTLISYKDYFRNAIFQNLDGSAGGAIHFETIYVGGETITKYNNSLKKRTPNTPFNNLTFNEFSMVDDYSFSNMRGIDTQNKLITTAVHSYQTSDKQFQIDLTNNNIQKTIDLYYSYFVKGDKDFPLFVSGNEISSNSYLNQFRKNNINYKNTFSINDKEPDQRLGPGRNEILKNMIFLNNAIELELKGLTFRSAGKFFSFDRKQGVQNSKYDDKVMGTYFAVQVNHIFSKDGYSNNIVGIKTYMFDNPKLKEVK
jgi:hypothetical protein